MNTILTARRKIYYETGSSGDLTVLYVPNQDAPRIHRGLDAKSASEVINEYGDSYTKTLARDIDGEVGIYGSLGADIVQRRRAMKVFLPQDFVSDSAQAYYFLFGDKHIAHGHKTTDDEGKEHWGSSVITIQGGNPTKIIASAISERMLDGHAESICVAVESSLEMYESLKKELDFFNVKVVPFASLKVDSKIKPLYQQRDNSLIMLLIAFLLMAAAAISVFFWWTNKAKVSELDRNIRAERQEIQQIQANNKLGHILNPKQLLEQIEVSIKRMPSSYMNAGAQIAKQFGTLEEVSVDLTQPVVYSMLDVDPNIRSALMVAQVSQPEGMLLVDQERIAQNLLESNRWIEKMENTALSSDRLMINIQMSVENKQDD